MLARSARDYFAEVFEPTGGWTDQADLDKAMRVVTPTQLEVIAKLGETGAGLVRLPGGFWTYEGCIPNGSGIPAWWVGTQTVRSMEKKGLLARTWFYVEEWRDMRDLAPRVKK